MKEHSMKTSFRAFAVLLMVAAPATAQETPQPPAAFDGITDQTARSAALFEEMGKVLQSPRCLNCHQGAGFAPGRAAVMEASAKFAAHSRDPAAKSAASRSARVSGMRPR